MRIAILHYSSPPIVGGVESVLAHHARLMTRAGHSVSIITGRGEPFDKRINVQVLPRLDSRHADVLAVKSQLDTGEVTPRFTVLREIIKQDLMAVLEDFDLLIAHNIATLHKNLPLTAAVFDLHQDPGFPALVLWHHDLAWTTPRYKHEVHDGYPWTLLRSTWENATHVVISEQRRQELTRLLGIPQECVRVIPNGVDLAAFYKLEEQTILYADQLKLIQADPLLLLPVRLTRRKNIELALQVLAELRQKFPKAMLLVTGPEGPHNPANQAYMNGLVKLRNDLNLQGAAHFMAEISNNFLPDAVIADFYRLADAIILPSREEGFGIPLIEGAFSSIPVFCADIPVLRELGGEDVTYFDPDGNPSTIAALIAGRINMEMTSRWSRRAKQSYAWDSIYNIYIEPLIQEIKR